MKLSPVQKAYAFAMLGSALITIGFAIAGETEGDNYTSAAKNTMTQLVHLITQSSVATMTTVAVSSAALLNFVATPLFGLFNLCCGKNNEDRPETQRLLTGSNAI